MKEKIKQKGFIQTPLLIGIIISLVAASAVTTGVILYKQGKSSLLVADVSEVFEGIEDAEPEVRSEELEIEQEQSLLEESNVESELQTAEQLEQSELEGEKVNQEIKVKESQQIFIEIPSEETEVLDSSLEDDVMIDPAEQIIEEFLEKPTFDNFKIFCEKAINIPTQRTIEVLSEDRERIEIKYLSLYQVIPSCKYLGDYFEELSAPLEECGVHFVISNQVNPVQFENTDSDTIRTRKIRLNEKIEEYNQNYDFFRFSATTIEGENLKETIELSLKDRFFGGQFLKTFSAPEEDVKQYQLNYY